MFLRERKIVRVRFETVILRWLEMVDGDLKSPLVELLEK